MKFPNKKIIKDKKYYREYQESHPNCEVCGKPGWLGPHHIIFRSQGGGDTWENLIRLCKKHHDGAHYHKKFWQPIFMDYKNGKNI